MTIATKTDFRSYILKMLGYPQIEIEVTTDQINEIITETIEKFVEYADDGVTLRLLELNVSSDILEYTLPDDTFAILDVWEGNNFGQFSAVFPDKFLSELTQHTLHSAGSDLLGYELSYEFIDTIKALTFDPVLFDFNSITKQIQFFEKPKVDKYGIMYYNNINELSNNVFNHIWIKKYAVAQTKFTWGNNIGKYENTLPNGLTINHGKIVSQAETAIEKLEEELEQVYSTPSFFFCG